MSEVRPWVAMPTRARPHIAAMSMTQLVASRCNAPFSIIQAEPATIARNNIVNAMLENDFTHVLMIDDDTVPQDPDTLSKLLALDTDIATGITPFGDGKDGFICNVQIGDMTEWMKPWPTGIFDVMHCGTACILIARHVFEAIEFPWFNYYQDRNGKRRTEDVEFCRKVREAGLTMRCDASIICDHIKEVSLLDYCPPLPAGVIAGAHLERENKYGNAE